jgi:adenine-specific DNA-methyltransferase
VTHADIWLGDSIELVKKFKPETIQSVITDPPFGVDNQSNMAVTEAGKEYATKIMNDESPEQAWSIFSQVMENLIPALKQESDIYIFTAHQVLEEWLSWTRVLLGDHGFTRKAVLVWQKDGPGMGDLQSWGMGCEFILYYKRGSRERTDARRNNVLSFPQIRPGELIHPHEKPEPLLELLVKHSTSPGDWIVDPFGGSGSLVRAARKLGRNSIGIELDPVRHERAIKKLNGGEGAGLDFGDD